MSRLSKIAILLVIGLSIIPCVVFGETPTGATTASRPDPEEAARKYFTDLEVIDQHGKPARFYSDILKDRVVLINFIFTSCENTCSIMTKKLIDTRSHLSGGIKDKVWFVSISIDPERDSPAALKAFAEDHKVDESRWIFLTGAKQNVDYIVTKLGQYTPEVETHSTLMLAGNTRTRHWKKVPPMVSAQEIAVLLRSMAEDGAG